MMLRLHAMNLRNRLIALVASLLLVSCIAQADSSNFNLGFTAGSASDDVGGQINIGYSFTNPNNSWWAVVTNISPQLPASNLASCLDCPFLSTQKFLVDPLTTLSSPTGLFDFSWAPDAQPGYSFAGQVSAEVVWLPFDPRHPITGFWKQVIRYVNANYEADVNGTAPESPSTVPEPDSLGLAAVGLIGLWGWVRKEKLRVILS
jgi:hypothetical protein